MKDEEEKMKEFMKDFTNAHGELPKSKWIDPIFHFAEKLLKVAIVIGIFLVIITSAPLAIQIYNKSISNLMAMDKQGFIRKIEKMYEQKIEIVEDKSSYKGNGEMILKTTKEPIIEFTVGKNIFDNYIIDYEDKAFIYYMENSNEPIFQGVELKRETKNLVYSQFGKVETLSCQGYLQIESYDKIEEGVRQLIAIKSFMEQKVKQFNVPLSLKIGEYTSSYDYQTEKKNQKLVEEEYILKEKLLYYWYLRDNGKDFSFILEEDLFEIDKPKVLDVYVNGEKIVDIHG